MSSSLQVHVAIPVLHSPEDDESQCDNHYELSRDVENQAEDTISHVRFQSDTSSDPQFTEELQTLWTPSFEVDFFSTLVARFSLQQMILVSTIMATTDLSRLCQNRFDIIEFSFLWVFGTALVVTICTQLFSWLLRCPEKERLVFEFQVFRGALMGLYFSWILLDLRLRTDLISLVCHVLVVVLEFLSFSSLKPVPAQNVVVGEKLLSTWTPNLTVNAINRAFSCISKEHNVSYSSKEQNLRVYPNLFRPLSMKKLIFKRKNTPR